MLFSAIGSRTVFIFGKSTCIFLVLYLLQPFAASAHDDSSGRITALTNQIALDPNNASLLLKRGELLRHDGHFKAALKDLQLAARRDGTLGEVDYQLGLTLLQLERAADAKSHLDRYIAIHPNGSKALVARARALVALGNRMKAATDFTRAIAHSPNPDYYIERARVLAAAGHVDEAVRGLDEGHKRLGTLVSLQRLAIDLDLARNNIDGAITRVDNMAAITGRTDLWLARRGDILLQAGRRDDALAAYGQALAAIETLSQRRHRSKTVRDLKNRLKGVLRQHAATENSTPLQRAEAPATQF